MLANGADGDGVCRHDDRVGPVAGRRRGSRKWRRVFVGAGLRRGLVLAVPQVAAVAVSGIVAPGGPASFLLFLFVRSVVASVGGGAGTERGGGLRSERLRSYMQLHAVSTCSRRAVAGANNANRKCDVENTDESDRRPSGAGKLGTNMHL